MEFNVKKKPNHVWNLGFLKPDQISSWTSQVTVFELATQYDLTSKKDKQEWIYKIFERAEKLLQQRLFA